MRKRIFFLIQREEKILFIFGFQFSHQSLPSFDGSEVGVCPGEGGVLEWVVGG